MSAGSSLSDLLRVSAEPPVFSTSAYDGTDRLLINCSFHLDHKLHCCLHITCVAVLITNFTAAPMSQSDQALSLFYFSSHFFLYYHYFLVRGDQGFDWERKKKSVLTKWADHKPREHQTKWASLKCNGPAHI